MTAATARRARERGAVAGLDALLFGTLILLTGTMLIVNLWSVIETRTALDAAAREYLRTYTTSVDAPTAAARGEHSVRSVLEQRGTPLHTLRIEAPDAARFGPCEPSTVHLAAVVPAVRVPFIAELGSTEVNVSATELVPPHRELVPGPDHDTAATPCAP